MFQSLLLYTFLGETYIAATQRPDGTWRKARKVKAGYVPQDEQPRFECRAQQALKQQLNSAEPKFPIGWAPQDVQQMSEIKTPHAAAEKRAVIRETPVIAIKSNNAPITPQDHLRKKIANLEKKLDDIEKLKVGNLLCNLTIKLTIVLIQQRIDNGELTNPEKTQLQKLKRQEVIRDEIITLTDQLEKL